ncbi:MAG: hypothetical protein J5I98_28140 [Phaeodactylibacter sp.]|nr:hypothetical protein [Phaeodactylibacter sp.]
MQDILHLLFWAGTIAGGLLILLLLISIFAGMDMGGDVDVDAGGDMDAHADADASDAGLGIVKALLTFISVGAFTARAILLNTSWSWTLVIITALIAGGIAVLLLTWFFRWLLRNQEEGTWRLWMAEGKMGTVYVPIPPGGKGRVVVKIDNVNREMDARTANGRTLATHEKVMVVEAKEGYVVVAPLEEGDIL